MQTLVPMKPAQPAQKPSALAVMANRLSVEPAKLLGTLKATCFRGASDDELLSLVVVANEYALNPFLRELYAFPKKGGGIVPIVGIDGWTRIATRHPDFDGVSFRETLEETGKPIACTAIIGVKGRSRPVEVTEYYDECFRETEPWRTMPKRMLRHRAFIQAARLAFGISGIVDEDEAETFTINADPEPQPEPVRRGRPPGSKNKPKDEIPGLEQPTAPVAFDTETPQGALATLFTQNGITLERFNEWALVSGNLDQAAESWAQIPDDVAKRIWAGRLALVELLKGGAE